MVTKIVCLSPAVVKATKLLSAGFAINASKLIKRLGKQGCCLASVVISTA